ncbi:MAG TPA: phosphoribosylformylglycinamidine synthase subunit PurQ [bacterium]|nr:phosphoribosylformylglycinamidine synthase subunit PurQ [bacterium]
MAMPRVLVLTGYGINCDFETKAAFDAAGASAERVHINDLISGDRKLADYQILAFPGGFSYGDDIASGKVLAVKSKVNLGDEIMRFIEAQKLIIGICNGFQVIAKYGLLADPDGDYRTQRVTVTFNDSNRYEDRWVHLLRVSDQCVWTAGVDRIYLPVAHGEGKFFATPERLDAIEKNGQVAFRYATPDYQPANGEFPLNPNGAQNDIAGICDPTGRILGMMPHPERFLHFTNHPHWTRIREELKRADQSMPDEGDGLKIFKNGVAYFN